MYWIISACLLLIVFGYGGYALFLPRRKSAIPDDVTNWPSVSFVIPAFNEADFLVAKIENTLACDYPKEKLEIIVAADGSTDDSANLVAPYNIRYENNGERKGKGVAMNRAARYASHEIIIFSDANAMLNPPAIKGVVAPLLLDQYGMSSGEKKVIQKYETENASAGEGLYWKYESYLKKRDNDFYSMVGAVGELFAIKRSCYTDIPPKFLVDDFYQAASVLLSGKKIAYVPKALATEYGSLNFKEETKRKIRISAGGYQSIVTFSALFNPFKNWRLAYIFLAHRVLRWTIIPVLYFLLPVVFAYQYAVHPTLFMQVLTGLSMLYFALALFGLAVNLSNRKAPFFINIPFYITLMNYCALAGGWRYVTGIESGAWEKVKRAA